MYGYTEYTAKRSVKEVTSILFGNLKYKSNMKNDLILISDGYLGQNSNFVMVFFLYMLIRVMKMFKSRYYIFIPNTMKFVSP